MLSHSPMRYVLVRVLVINIANKDKIASLGGIEAIIEAMSTHKDHSAVQEKACGALWNLAANDGFCLLAWNRIPFRPVFFYFIPCVSVHLILILPSIILSFHTCMSVQPSLSR